MTQTYKVILLDFPVDGLRCVDVTGGHIDGELGPVMLLIGGILHKFKQYFTVEPFILISGFYMHNKRTRGNILQMDPENIYIYPA